MRVLITGANGFVGAHLVRDFAKFNFDVLAVAGKSDSKDSALAEFGSVSHLDLRNLESLRDLIKLKPDLLIHCAALSTPAQCWDNKDLTNEINVYGVRNLLKSFPDTPVIFTSTDLVFEGAHAPPQGFEEKDAAFPLTTYAQSKVMAEGEVLRHASGVIVRLSLVYGPPIFGIGGNLGWLKNSIVEHKKVNLFFDEYRTPLHISDIAQAMRKIFDFWPPKERLFHLAGPESISRYDFGMEYLKHLNINSDLVERSSQKSFVSKEPRAPNVSLSSALFSRMYDFKFMTVEQGLQRTVTE